MLIQNSAAHPQTVADEEGEVQTLPCQHALWYFSEYFSPNSFHSIHVECKVSHSVMNIKSVFSL